MKSNKKNVPIKGQASLFSFFKKKTSEVDEEKKQKQKDEKLAPDVRQCSPVEIKQTTAANPPAPYVIVEDDKSLYIGRCVRVYWPNEKEWYGGKIESYDADEGTHSVRYDDGDQEDLFLDKEKFVFVDEVTDCKKRRNADGGENGALAVNSSPAKKVKITAKSATSKKLSKDSDSEEEFKLESTDESSDDDDGFASEYLSDSESDDNNQKNATKRLKKGAKVSSNKRKKICDSDDDIDAVSSKTVSRPPKPTTTSKLTCSPSYHQFNASSQSSPSHSATSTPQFTPGAGVSTFAPNITPSPRQGGNGTPARSNSTPGAKPKSPSTPSTVNRIPLPEGVSGLGSHDHNKWSWLKVENRKDREGRKVDHPDYDPRTIYIPPQVFKEQTPAMRQWFEIKQDYFDTVLFFKVGKFYELFHMDADIGMSELDLIYMKGSKAHSGFPEVSYGKYASQLVSKGYRVARVEQTETPEMLKERNTMLKKQQKTSAKVVAREMCSIVSKGTRTFCHLDDMSILESSSVGKSQSLLLCVKEMPVEQQTDDAVVEYGLCFVDPVLCTVTLAQFQDDMLRNRLRTVISHHRPTEVLLERDSHSAESEGTIQLMAPDASIVILHQDEVPQSGTSTVTLLEEGQYFTENSYPSVLQACIDGLSDGSSNLVMSALGGCIRFLQRSLIDFEVLSHGRCYAYVPPDLGVENKTDDAKPSGSTPPKTWVDVDVAANSTAGTAKKKNMVLDAITMNNLEILTNTFDHSEKGSLWAFMNHCRTPFGCRLLKEWICKPLYGVKDIQSRSKAVDELMVMFSDESDRVRRLLKGCPDVERLLSRVHANGLKKRSAGGQAHPESRAIMYETTKYNSRKIRDFMDLLSGLDVLVNVCEIIGPAASSKSDSRLLRMVIAPSSGDNSSARQGKFPLEEIKSLLVFFRDLFDEKQAKRDGFIRPKPGKDEEYDQAKAEVAELEKCFEEYLREQKRESGIVELSYFGSNKDRYQLEVPMKKANQAPKHWTSKSQKKTHRRYWTPYIEETLARLIASEDRLKEAQNDTMRRVFEKFDQSVGLWSTAISCAAMLDALLALASVSSAPNYTWATLVPPKSSDCEDDSEQSLVDIRGGRHPMLERAMEDRGDGSFIANDVLLGGSTLLDNGYTQDDSESRKYEYGARMMLVSGPNMGGKSTLLRQTCLIAIMAQVGCKVPADQAVLTPVDRIFTRLGASDKILSGQSTFFVELAETAMILKYATNHSLCILDELGRGTSTFDGTAIAHAVVEHLVSRVQCVSLFATHYHSLINDWSLDPRVKLGHMDCFVQNAENGNSNGSGNGDVVKPAPGEEVTFLYKLCAGSSPRSYGINVARLARLPEEILEVAYLQSSIFEDQLSKQKSQLSDSSSNDENLDKKSLYSKIYDRIVSIAKSDISASEMVWLVREIWQRFEHVVSIAK